jgi:hypothetical protein
MKFARIVFGIAAAYGFALLLSMYFLIDRVGRDNPPPITHPEFYYGFLGVALLWQVVFILIAAQPERYRPLMLVAIFEKVVYTLPVVIMYAAGRVPAQTLGPALVDPIFGVLFVVAWVRTRKPATASRGTAGFRA